MRAIPWRGGARSSAIICGSLFLTIFAVLAGESLSAQVLPPPPLEKSADANVKLPEFDVASVKVHKNGDGFVRWMPSMDGFNGENIPVTSLISAAYDVKQDLITGGPGWIGSRGFDIQAKVASADLATFRELSGHQRAEMLRSILEERFHLQLHVATRDLPTYDLVSLKGEPKVQTAAPSQDGKPLKPSISMSPGKLEVERSSIDTLVTQLGYVVHRTVIDKTGLIGKYNYTLVWTPEEKLGSSVDPSESGAAANPLIFTAIQEQMGLKLVPSRGPVKTIVIDHIEMPTEN